MVDNKGNPVAKAVGVVAIWARHCVDAPLSLSDVCALLASTAQVVNKPTISVPNLFPVAISSLKDKDTFRAPYLSTNKTRWISTEKVVT